MREGVRHTGAIADIGAGRANPALHEVLPPLVYPCFGPSVGAWERSEGVAEECSEQSRNGTTRANAQTEALRHSAHRVSRDERA